MPGFTRGVDFAGNHDIEVIEVQTSSRLPICGMMKRKRATSSAPERKALSTFIRTDPGPGRAPIASGGNPAPPSGRSGTPFSIMERRYPPPGAGGGDSTYAVSGRVDDVLHADLTHPG